MMDMKIEFYAIVCAWCKRTLELKGTDDPKMQGTTSHGICESCKEKMLDE